MTTYDKDGHIVDREQMMNAVLNGWEMFDKKYSDELRIRELENQVLAQQNIIDGLKMFIMNNEIKKGEM